MICRGISTHTYREIWNDGISTSRVLISTCPTYSHNSPTATLYNVLLILLVLLISVGRRMRVLMRCIVTDCLYLNVIAQWCCPRWSFSKSIYSTFFTCKPCREQNSEENCSRRAWYSNACNFWGTHTLSNHMWDARWTWDYRDYIPVLVVFVYDLLNTVWPQQ